MPFIEFKDYNIIVSPEALVLKPLSALWKRDKTKDKVNALRDIGYIYHVYDPGSDYRKSIINEEDRIAKVKKDMGFDPSWVPDKVMKEAIEFYVDQPFMNSDEMKALDTAMTSLEKIRNLCEDIDLAEEEDPLKAAKTLADLTKLIPGLVTVIKDAKNALHDSIMEMGRARGTIQKKVAEDGFDKFIS